MKYVKMLGLAAIAAAALMAFVGVGSASATELTCGENPEVMCPVETTIHAESEGNVTLDAPFGNVVCSGSTVQGHTTNTGGSTETVDGPITALTFTGCGSNTVTVLKFGELIIHTTKENEINHDGTLTSTGTEVTVIHLGVHCIARTKETDLGWLTGSTTTGSTTLGSTATLDISARIPIVEGEGGGLCGTSAPWTGSYKFTSPSTLNIDGGAELTGEAPTGNVGDTLTVTWNNVGAASATIDDETNSNGEVAETLGSGCETIAASGSCSSRKVKCLKKGEATLTARDTPEVTGSLVVKCDELPLTGEPTTANVGETVTVTWKNRTESAMVIEDETISDSTVAETLGSSCGEIAATGTCTSRKLKCLK
ncbi:MAG: hypothetical protein J2P17_34270, partial [Mycobacterium sp.]|nr:hypothetical protein [Mycobacterium sp.]